MPVIKLDKPTKVSELKKAFNAQFPYLKLEFFKKKHKALQGSAKKDLITDDFEILPEAKETVIVIEESMPVAELEKQLSEKLKLSVQVFRKSGRTWLETTFTDNWTLQKQNQSGMEISEF